MKVTYIDHMGTDLSVVNAARVSFGKVSEWANADRLLEYPDLKPELPERDTSLIQFLARGCTTDDWEQIIEDIMATSLCDVVDPDLDPKDELLPILNHIRRMPDHWTPFSHTAITLHIKAPIFIARQLGKHQVGMVWNEVSRRYVSDVPEFYIPDTWREKADNVKQGSSDGPSLWNHGMGTGYREEEYEFYETALGLYQHMLDVGVCAEQARMILPQSMYTEWYWTGNLYSFANVFNQRSDSHAQKECQVIAHQIAEVIKPLFPVSWGALTNG